uniref:E3 ubiquitin-protein ligase XIAP-like n=1 Tax=Styela clava TaxID=7725 RepID=UPI0019397C75|nr:E3 ubiquitin-protein ligase XIAP-like [Styela clava]XP_039263551.1 E3 ubiquitin-protein ligase XIAP-like [Styela clava]
MSPTETPNVTNENSPPSAPASRSDVGAAGSTKPDITRRSGDQIGSLDDEIELDGTINSGARDAPGQSCVYIPSGPHFDEFYRLSTYSKFPLNVPVKVGDLAAAGLYYTGFRDRVKCFSCGMSVENWMLGDDGMDRKWHKSDCAMANGGNYLNVALPTPNFRTLLRVFKGLPSTSSATIGGRKDNYAAAPKRGNQSANMLLSNSSAAPMDVTEVTSNMGRVRLNETTLPQLEFANIVSTEHRDMLLRINLKKEVDRRSTFTKWPSYPAPYLPSELAKEGFFYLGNLDRTQCFSCSGVLRNWTHTDNVFEQHRKHFPECRMVRKVTSGNIPMEENERREADETERARLANLLPSGSPQEPQDPSPEEQRRLAELFPCRAPVNPHMRTLQNRIESFQRNWPNRILATPSQIAKAGFFFLGESDKTKCFYCNGGLQNWDANDEPWTEHAKWFPGCEFVIRQKGTEFVRQIADQHPNLNRPHIRNPASYDIPPEIRHSTSPQPMDTRNPNSNSSNIKVDELISMGFLKEKIERLIRRKSNQGGYANIEEIIQDLLQVEDSEEASASPQPTLPPLEGAVSAQPVPANAGVKRGGVMEASTQVKKNRTSSPATSINPEDIEMARSLRIMEQESICKMCKKNKTEILFIPCGHLCVCEECATKLKRCILCKSKVQSTLKECRA